MMANHKKRRAINQRAGCKLCKPWKMNGIGEYKNSPADQRVLQESVKDASEEAQYYNHPYYYDPDYEDDWWEDQGLLEFLKEYNVK